MNSKRELEVKLSKLKQISSPKTNLEQYPISSNVAAEILWFAYMNNDIKNKVIADLGCGNGILGIGALLLGAKKVFLLDLDSNSILTTKENIKYLKNSILLHEDISNFNEKVDTVIQNPPFGVQNEHADRIFLIKAMEVSNKIYSFHKIESKSFIIALVHDYSFKINKIINFNFILKKTQKFHTKNKYSVNVACFILHRNL